ncbi:MAG TPA: hypothetical protein VFK33_10155 [Bacillales bacterium]|nr:hypothetical protein [Bacillales bacterium]
MNELPVGEMMKSIIVTLFGSPKQGIADWRKLNCGLKILSMLDIILLLWLVYF